VAIAGGTVLTTLLSFLFVPALFLIFSQRCPFKQTLTPVQTQSLRIE